MTALQSNKDGQLFFSHTWRNDRLGRNNHARVVKLAGMMREVYGWNIWIDEEKLKTGNIDVAMANGIEQCELVLVCITEEYCRKVHTGLQNIVNDDNCAKEWNCAISRNKIMIPIIMEPFFTWPAGVVTLQLGRCMYIDASSNDTAETCNMLNCMLTSYNLSPNVRQIGTKLPRITKCPVSNPQRLRMWVELYREVEKSAYTTPHPPTTPPYTGCFPRFNQRRRILCNQPRESTRLPPLY
jgi:hypothetical protein